MRRFAILSFFMSILISSCSLVPTQAVEINLPSKADYETALTKLNSFINYAQSYASTTQYPQEYKYLDSLITKTNILIARYDDVDFTINNAAAYSIAITAIDQAIESCRYIFGIVRAENLANQTTQPTTPSSPMAQDNGTIPVVQTPNMQPAQSTTISTVTATTTEAKTDKQPNSTDSATITTFQATDSQDATDESLPVEIPKTGGISQSSSILFIVIMSFVAAIAATGIYFVYNHQAKPATPAAARRKRR